MMSGELQENHRTRVAAERRERTRARLLESALLVFSEKGPEAAVIDKVIAQAGMSRGSFYNYFRTNEELLEAVAAEISNELLRTIDPAVQLLEDPVARVACGARLLLRAVRSYPLLGAFLARLPLPTVGSKLIGIEFLARDLGAGIAKKRFTCAQPRVAIDVAVGITFSAAHSLSREKLPENYPEAVVKAMLQGLGIEENEAERVTALALPDIAMDDASILKRTLKRADTNSKAH